MIHGCEARTGNPALLGKNRVQYKGQPVWIDGVDERTATARVHIEGNPANSMAVEVGQLEEK